jgi:hypothetical protein
MGMVAIPAAAEAAGTAGASTARTSFHVSPGSLLKASKHARGAERSFVSDANTLRACLGAHATGCAGVRARLQKAGRHLQAAERRLGHVAHSTAGNARTASHVSAPTLTVSGEQLQWSRVDRIGDYVVARDVPGQSPQAEVVSTTSVTPPPVAGTTVVYAVRAAVNGAPWSAEVSITYPAATPVTEATQPQAAPTLTVSGDTLDWNAVAGASTYVLATKVPGEAVQYSVVAGTTVTPPAVPGKTVSYSVRTAVEGSAWGVEASITYPATQSAAESPSSPQTGINSGVEPTDFSSTSVLGAKLVRLAFPIEASAAQIQPAIEKYAAIGVRVLPLATFTGRVPSAAEAQNVAKWAAAYGPGGTFWAGRADGSLAIQSIEFGNETSYGYQYGDNAGEASYMARAKTYAIRFKEAAESISATGVTVGLLAQVEDWTGNWMNAVYSAVPNFSEYVAGWVSHPYGSEWHTKLQDILNETAAHGAPSTIPIDITEWGVTTDNGRCLTENYGLNKCMSYSEAAATLRTTFNEMRQMLGSRFGMFMLYQVRDQQVTGTSTEPEAYFGALQHQAQPKGAYTTQVQELLASH